MTPLQTYVIAVASHEAARDQYHQALTAMRTWPFNHDAEHQQPDEAALEAVADAAVALGFAGDARDAAWRAYKKEAKSHA